MITETKAWHEPEIMAGYSPDLLPECRKSTFDMTASVRMFRFDLQAFNGHIHPETYSRVLDEELSLIVEGIGRAARTSFALKRSEATDNLIYFKSGHWRSYDDMLNDGLTAAEAEAEVDSQKEFKRDMALKDKYRGGQMRQLKPGQRLSWTSPYRHDKEAAYGSDFMDDSGFVSERKLGFVYQATCLEDGSVLLETQTLDLSDPDGFAAIEEAIKDNPDIDMDTLVEIYDYTLSQKYEGETFHAGRKDFYENVWDWVRVQDLKNFLVTGLEDLARGNLTGKGLEVACKRHIYGMWAAYKKRLDGTAYRPELMRQVPGFASSEQAMAWAIRQEVRWAYSDFVSRKHVMVGCGGSISMLENEEDLFNLSSEDAFSTIFGRGKMTGDSCTFTSKECPSCHKKNVKTTSVNEKGKTVYIGACGCRSDQVKK